MSTEWYSLTEHSPVRSTRHDPTVMAIVRLPKALRMDFLRKTFSDGISCQQAMEGLIAAYVTGRLTPPTRVTDDDGALRWDYSTLAVVDRDDNESDKR